MVFCHGDRKVTTTLSQDKQTKNNTTIPAKTHQLECALSYPEVPCYSLEPLTGQDGSYMEPVPATARNNSHLQIQAGKEGVCTLVFCVQYCWQSQCQCLHRHWLCAGHCSDCQAFKYASLKILCVHICVCTHICVCVGCTHVHVSAEVRE